MQFIQSNSLIKSTLMFNVLQKSACMQSSDCSATVGRTDTMDYRPCIAAWPQKVGVRARLDPPLPESGWSGPPDSYRNRMDATDQRNKLCNAFLGGLKRSVPLSQLTDRYSMPRSDPAGVAWTGLGVGGRVERPMVFLSAAL